MNLFFRFFYHIFLSFLSKPLQVNEMDQVKLRVWPNDLDMNFHLNNGRYLSMMDLGRTRLSLRTGLFNKAKQNGWGYGVVGGLNITYLKSLAPLQSFTLKSKLAGHYDGWLYIEQRFESKGRLAAAALVKVVFLKGKMRVSPDEIKKVLGIEEIGDNAPYLEHLFNSEQEFLKSVKKDY